MATPEQLQAMLSSRRARQPFWKTKQDDYLNDRSYSPSDGSRPVLSIRIVVNQVFGNAGQAGAPMFPMAHFRILLILDDNPAKPASVELNSTGVTVTGSTTLFVSSHNWISSTGRALKFVEKDICPVQGKTLTVDNILDILVNNNRHHYKLHDSGSGCRYWTKVVLRDLIGVGFLAPGSDGVVAAIMADISRVRPDVLMLANAEGTFFQ